MRLLASRLVRHTLPLAFAVLATLFVLMACGDRRTEAEPGPATASR